MFLSNASIKRPVAMGCLLIGLVLLGVNAYRKLGVENLPKMDIPFVTVVTVYPGATPEEVETDIAKKIEDAVVSVDGLKHISSSCMENVCQTLLEFDMSVDQDMAAVDVREKLDLIKSDLPADAEDPKVLKFDVNAKPVLNMGLTGDVGLDELYDYADNQLSDRISTLLGVAEVQIIGGSEREVAVSLDRHALSARGLTSLHVVQALQNGVKKIPSGRIRSHGTEYSVIFDAETATLADIGEIQVTAENGERVRVKDIAVVAMGAEERRQAAFIDGKPGIAIRVVKKSDANAVAVVERVRKAFDSLRKELPGGMELTWVSDDGAFIQSSVDTGVSNILQGVLLTAAILLLFLHNVRSTFVVAISMPITVLIALWFLQLMGYTLNISTLLALALSVGLLVTNSIVVLESIVDRVKRRESPGEASAKGTGEVAVAVLASAGTNIVVLFPIAMMGSKVGEFVRPFAVTMVIATAVSLFTSFTLTPILSSKLLKRVEEGVRRSFFGRFGAWWDRMFSWVERLYERVLRFNERNRWAALLILLAAAVMLVHSLTLVPKVGFTMVRDFDQGELYVKLEFPTYYSLGRTVERTRRVEETLRALPDVRHVFTTIGKVEGIIGKSSEGVYLAQVFIKFCEKMDRDTPVDEIAERVRGMLATLPDAIATVSVPGAIGGQSTPIELEISGDDLRELDRVALNIRRISEEMGGFKDLDTTVRSGKPEIRLYPDRPVLADLGLPVVPLGANLRGNIEGIEAASYKRGDRTYDIRVKYAEEEGTGQVAGFLLPALPGKPMPVTAVAAIRESRAPVQITRMDKRRIAKLTANLRADMPLGTAVNRMLAAIKEENVLPPGYSLRFGGVYEVMAEMMVEFLEAAIMAMLLTYLTLAAILESFTKPFIILATLPLGLVGMIWGLYLSGEALSFFALLGGVMLIGIVVNNAILILSEEQNLMARGESAHNAMIHAARDQLRPIIMITLAAALGMLPLGLGRGLGSEARVGIGWGSIGGIMVSGLLTLIVIPIMYDLLTRRNGRH